MTLQKRALPHTRETTPSHSPSFFRSLLQDGRFSANPGLGQISDKRHCLLRPSPRHRLPTPPTWLCDLAGPTPGACALSAALQRPEQPRPHQQPLCVVTHHSATTIPEWCPPPVKLHSRRPSTTTSKRRPSITGTGRSKSSTTTFVSTVVFPKPPPERKMHDDGENNKRRRHRHKRETGCKEDNQRNNCDSILVCGLERAANKLISAAGPLCARKRAENWLENAFTVLPFHTCCGFMLPTNVGRGWLHNLGIP